jgi:uncharacterized protein with NRDE domain
MCLILVAWKVHPDVPLAVAANRDEFHARPAARAAFWEDRPDILAGRDLQAGGTWMGVSRGGRFAAVTNCRGATEPGAAESRGSLVTRYLDGARVAEIAQRKSAFSGFNLLACDGNALWWLSNRDSEARQLPPGWYGLGNLLLDSPDVEPHKQRFRDCPLSMEPLFGVLAQARIVNERYGTRCSSVLLWGAATRFAERAFDTAGVEQETLHFELDSRRATA